MATKNVKVRTIVLTVDQEWFEAIARMTEMTEPGEVCYWHTTTGEYDWPVDVADEDLSEEEVEGNG